MSLKDNIGTLWEKLFPKMYGGKRVKGSGNQWYAKLDVEGTSLLISLKATKNESYRLTKKDIEEAFDAVNGPGGVGGDYVPLIVIDFVEKDEPRTSDKILAVVEMNSLYQLLQENRKLFVESKNDAKHRQAAIPSLFRK